MSQVVSLNNVSIRRGDAIILHDVNLTVQNGEFCYLIGPTGSGKTSLLKLIYGDLEVETGSAEVVGFDTKKLTFKKIPSLRRKLGIVFQDFQLLTDRNVLENLKFVLKATGWTNKREMEQRVTAVLELVGLTPKVKSNIFELSGGEKQRVAIARALLNNPELIIADEPTGNLDPETADGIIQLLHQINQEVGTPIIMATHDFRILEKFPARILRCYQGSITDVEVPTYR